LFLGKADKADVTWRIRANDFEQAFEIAHKRIDANDIPGRQFPALDGWKINRIYLSNEEFN
jgi:hypothetical protein